MALSFTQSRGQMSRKERRTRHAGISGEVATRAVAEINTRVKEREDRRTKQNPEREGRLAFVARRESKGREVLAGDSVTRRGSEMHPSTCQVARTNDSRDAGFSAEHTRTHSHSSSVERVSRCRRSCLLGMQDRGAGLLRERSCIGNHSHTQTRVHASAR